MPFPKFFTGCQPSITSDAAVQMSTGTNASLGLMLGVQVAASANNPNTVYVGGASVTIPSTATANETAGIPIAPGAYAFFDVTTADQLYCIAGTTAKHVVSWWAQ